MIHPRHRFGLCVYGIQYLTGAAGRGTPLANPRPLTAEGFLSLAVERSLSSIEVPLAYISPSLDAGALREYAGEARRQGLEVVVAGPSITGDADLEQQIRLSAAMEARRMRCVGSGLLCGDRSPVGGAEGWRRHVDKEMGILKSLAPLAEELDVRIGLENHQDHDSGDLIRICESVGSTHVGVTLDAGNPIAVGEDPLEFAERILPYLVNVHLKDYRMVDTPEGFRLVHCAIGDGVIDFAGLWPILDRRPEVPRGIEMAALSERHIRIFTPAYWDGYETREARSLAPVMRLLRDRSETIDDPAGWMTPLETGDAGDAGAWETDRLEASIRNLAGIAAGKGEEAKGPAEGDGLSAAANRSGTAQAGREAPAELTAADRAPVVGRVSAEQPMARTLAGKVAIVTGAARGLGRAYALRLAALGADVVVCDIRLDAAVEFGEALAEATVADECRAHGVRAVGITADLTDRQQVASMVDQAVAELGGIDILVNNAGGMLRPIERSAASTMDLDDLQFIMDVNLMSTVHCCQLVVPTMKARGGGRIVNVSSTAAFSGGVTFASYGMAKAAIIRYTRSLATELGPFGIHVNCIAPSLIATSRANAQFPERVAAAERIPLRRLGTPEDAAKVVEFLCTDLSDYVTGQCIVVCGGNYLNVS